MTDGFFRYANASDDPPVGRTILAGLSDEEWAKLIAFAARRRYAPAATIVDAHEQNRAIFLVVSGRVRVTAGRPGGFGQRVNTIEPGGIFGILSFLNSNAGGALAVAEGPVELLMISHDMFEQLAAWQPRIAIALLRDLAANVTARLRHYEFDL